MKHRPSEILLQQWETALQQAEITQLQWDIIQLQMQIILQSYEHIISDWQVVSSKSESDDLEIHLMLWQFGMIEESRSVIQLKVAPQRPIERWNLFQIISMDVIHQDGYSWITKNQNWE